ncbi:RimK/LysX family protein [Shewanella vesiculosa]|uniref:RimK/LysX family protein n=1 Tax=Shewanella vesiculosa TaxID=518738 RepID=A0ABV0FNJ9_9GAMM
MFKRIVIAAVLCFLSISVFASDKTVLRQVETMTVAKSGLHYRARIDTGAANTSLHAVDIDIIGGASKKMKNDVGKVVEFTTQNERGEKKRIQAEIVSTSRVKNSQGIETRYMVKLDVGFANEFHNIHVNLRDRSHMNHKLLIGRNFLKHDYIVDVSDKKMIGPLAELSIKQTGLLYNTRIDTGAVENSLHAVNIRVDKEDTVNIENNIGKMITFTTANEKGQQAEVRTKIRGTSLIRNAQGTERRYMVRLNVGEPRHEYVVDVNLKDRSKMGYKLLIGRNWLQGHYMVDVSKKH